MWHSPDDCLDNQILDILPHLGRVDSLSLHVVPQSLQTPASTEIIRCMHWNHRAPYPSTNTELICTIILKSQSFQLPTKTDICTSTHIESHIPVLITYQLKHVCILYPGKKKRVWKCISIQGARFKMAFCCKVKF